MSYGVYPVTVSTAVQLSRTFRRLTLAAPELARLRWAGADQRIKLLVVDDFQLAEIPTDPAEGQPDWYSWWSAQPDELRPPMRTYTIAAHRPNDGEVDVDFAVHGDTGPLSRFAESAQPGDRLLMIGPGPDASTAVGVAWRPGAATQLLCVGDETALPAIRNIVAALDPGQSCQVVVEVPHASDRLPLPSAARLTVDYQVRAPGARVGQAAERVLFAGGASPSSPTEWDPDLWQEAAEDKHDRYAWVAGEVGWVNRLRRPLAHAGFGRGNAAFMGYWREGHPARG